MADQTAGVFSNPPKGFRLFKTDLVLLALGALLPLVFQKEFYGISYLFSFTIFHFFLFCNVFRTGAFYEILWAVIFIAHFLYRCTPEGINWVELFVFQTPVTLGVVAIEVMTGRYRGIFYGRFSKE